MALRVGFGRSHPKSTQSPVCVVCDLLKHSKVIHRGGKVCVWCERAMRLIGNRKHAALSAEQKADVVSKSRRFRSAAQGERHFEKLNLFDVPQDTDNIEHLML